jgi:hypothetical protein
VTTIAVTTSNIRGNPLQRYAPVVARMRQAARLPGINIGQEIDPGNRTKARKRTLRKSYAALWEGVMGVRGKATIGGHTEVPISLPVADWDRHDDTQHLVHGGKHKVSPARFINEWRGQHTHSGEKVCVLACHPVSKGYKTGIRARFVSAMAWRRQALATYEQDLRHLVTSAHADGYTVIFGGDMNHPSFPRMVTGEIVLRHSGLDHLRVLPAAGYRIAGIHTQAIARNRAMDHPILHATFDLRKVG